MPQLKHLKKEELSSPSSTRVYLDSQLDAWINKQAASLKCSPDFLLKHYLIQGIIIEAQQDTASPRKYADVLRNIEGEKAKQVLKKLTRIIQNRNSH